MQKFKWLMCGVVLPLLVVTLALSGCKKSPPEDDLLGEDGGGGGGKTVVKMTGVKMGNGVIKGRVLLKGDKPNLEAMTKNLHEQIAKKDDRAECMRGTPDEIMQQRYRIGGNGGVGNVFVWVTPPDKKTFFEFSAEDIKKLDLKPVEVGQPHCAFQPHAALAFPSYRNPKDPKKYLPTGQTFTVVNDAVISHNTKWGGGSKTLEGNQTLPGKKDGMIVGKAEIKLVPESVPIRIECSIHPWMDAYVWALDHPYASVTKYNMEKPDEEVWGTFEIRNVPTGVKLKIVAWHEEGGWLAPDKGITGGYEIELKDGETKTFDEFKLEPPAGK